MGVSNLMARLKPQADHEHQEHSDTPTPVRADSNLEKDNVMLDDSPVKYLTWRSFILGLCVSMGGFIFGYSTGMSSSPWRITMLLADFHSRSNCWLYDYE